MPDYGGYSDLYDWLTGWNDETFNPDFTYDISEQNPYLSEYQFTQPQGQLGPAFQGYQGISPEIMNALANAFEFDFTNTEFTLPGGELPPLEISGGEYQMTPGDLDFSLSTALGFTDIFDPRSIAYTLSQLGELGGEEGSELGPIRAAEVSSLTPEMFEKTESQYYDPYESAERGKLIEGLSSDVSKISPGGFAGSGIYSGKMSGAEKEYEKGYGGVLEDIMGMRGGATEKIFDRIYGWGELLSDVT